MAKSKAEAETTSANRVNKQTKTRLNGEAKARVPKPQALDYNVRKKTSRTYNPGFMSTVGGSSVFTEASMSTQLRTTNEFHPDATSSDEEFKRNILAPTAAPSSTLTSKDIQNTLTRAKLFSESPLSNQAHKIDKNKSKNPKNARDLEAIETDQLRSAGFLEPSRLQSQEGTKTRQQSQLPDTKGTLKSENDIIRKLEMQIDGYRQAIEAMKARAAHLESRESGLIEELRGLREEKTKEGHAYDLAKQQILTLSSVRQIEAGRAKATAREIATLNTQTGKMKKIVVEQEKEILRLRDLEKTLTREKLALRCHLAQWGQWWEMSMDGMPRHCSMESMDMKLEKPITPQSES